MTPEEIRKEYDFLDEDNLEMFLWEFIRRNSFYRKIFNALTQELPKCVVSSNTEVFSATEIKFTTSSKLVNDTLEVMTFKFGIKPNYNVNPDYAKGYLIKEIINTDYYLGIPDPSICYDKISPFPIVQGASPVAKKLFKPEALKQQQDKLYKYCHTFLERISPSGKEHTLFVGIALNARKNEVMEELENIVNEYIKDKKLSLAFVEVERPRLALS